MKVAAAAGITALTCASPSEAMDWHQINWAKCHSYVRSLQVRIVKATKEGRWNKVKALQHLLTHSFSAKALAVKRVTENSGKNTPGVDGETWSTPKSKMEATLSLKSHGYKPKPLKRVYIPKANGKKRPLGIPTMYDRAMQALYLQALEPVAETTGDHNSYGFRSERCTADARQELFNLLGRSDAAQWVLEGYIKGCFDNISHDWMLMNIPMDKKMLQKWLKAGFIDKKHLFPTEAGTPQGGIISPALANMVLDGLEELLLSRFKRQHFRINGAKGTKSSYGSYRPKVHLVRYADDFIITADKKEILVDEVLPLVEQFMKQRGLELSQEKTKITHIDEGFDFLGWNFRKYEGKLIIKPSTDNIRRMLKNIRAKIKANATTKQEDLIGILNPIVLGWGNYHKGAVASKVFAKVDHEIWTKLWRWARRRHPSKGGTWVKDKYWVHKDSRNWVFEAKNGSTKTKAPKTLRKLSDIKIRRFIKIRSGANPFDPDWNQYFESRMAYKMTMSLEGRKSLLALWRTQKGICPICKQPITDESGWDTHHIQPVVRGGADNNSNKMLLHGNCHRKYHSEHGLETGPYL